MTPLLNVAAELDCSFSVTEFQRKPPPGAHPAGRPSPRPAAVVPTRATAEGRGSIGFSMSASLDGSPGETVRNHQSCASKHLHVLLGRGAPEAGVARNTTTRRGVWPPTVIAHPTADPTISNRER
jgi:hypothetical protein